MAVRARELAVNSYLLALPLGLLPCGGVACPSPSSTSASASTRGLFRLSPASILALKYQLFWKTSQP